MFSRVTSSILIAFLMIAATHSKVTAAACDNSLQYGSVKSSLSILPTTGTYIIWTRMQVPDSAHSQFNLEINNQSCYVVGGSSITPNTWTWVNFQDGNLSTIIKYNFDRTIDNSARLIGTFAGVKVDRLLLIKNSCVPVGLGANCQTESARTTIPDMAGASSVPPPSSRTIGGLIIVSPTVQKNPELIQKVVYFADGLQVPTAASFALDSTLLTNGEHQISMQITETNGTVINETTNINVLNNESVLSPFIRWIRLNTHAAIVFSSLAGGVLLLLALLITIRHILLQKRLLSFHGF
jgi:hypothetical protein